MLSFESLPRRETARAVLYFRAAVFALALFYALRMVVVHSLVTEPFGPFRWLTYWANLAALACAWLMLSRSRERSRQRFDGLVSATCVIGGLVVYLFWSLYFKDPASVAADGLGPWWQEGYYHLGGPLLVWIDALFILRAFRAPRAAVAWLIGVVGAWLGFIELLVRPLNDTPVGTVTSGLPYPFLNNMELSARLPFYAMNIGAGLGLLAVLTVLAWGIRSALARLR